MARQIIAGAECVVAYGYIYAANREIDHRWHHWCSSEIDCWKCA